jgi:5-methylcytosine-specific restriction endonuclease McrA
MGHKRKPIVIGTKFNRLTIIEELSDKQVGKAYKRRVKCVCDCGTTTEALLEALVSNKKRSCGCLHKETFKREPAIQVGDRFNRLLVVSENSIKISPGGSRKKVWNLLCDCGNSHTATTSSLTTGTVKSCGCYHSETSIENSKKSRYKIIKPNRGFNVVLGIYKTSAKKRNLEFSLTDEEFAELITDNCTYCGETPVNSINVSTKTFGEKYFLYNGIDRKDNMLGYTLQNSITCCSVCNHAKHTMSEEVFKAWLNKVFKYQNLEVLIQKEQQNG